MTKLRMDLIDQYYDLYRARNLSGGNSSQFRKNYERLSLMWLELSDEERIAVSARFSQENIYLWIYNGGAQTPLY